jgi:hypothetical protein
VIAPAQVCNERQPAAEKLGIEEFTGFDNARRLLVPNSKKLATVVALQTCSCLLIPKVPRLVQHRLEFPAIG